MPRNGPIYDNALRYLAEADVRSMCRWLGLDVAGDAAALRLSEALPATTQHVDLLAQLGPGRLAQVEFVRLVEPDLGLRMLEYRARIMRREPRASLRQHVVVLGSGRVVEPVYDGEELMLRLHVTYVREHDPAELLAAPSLAPLAVLGRSDGPTMRREIFGEALAVIVNASDPARREPLAETAAVLATVHLDARTIEAVWKESGMPISLGETDLGRELERRGEARGEIKGAQRKALTLLTALLVAKFGEDPRIPQLVDRLARSSEDEAISAITSAGRLQELVDEFG